jgi:hypothetical protein
VAAREDALAVWFAARVAEGKEPDADRVTRVREKLADADALLVVAERAGRTVGMALAEPFRDLHATGPVTPAAATCPRCSWTPSTSAVA